MTFPERNNLIDEAIVKYKKIHDRFTCNAHVLTYGEWKQYVDDMDSIAESYKNTKISMISGRLCMLFLDDTEEIYKKLKEKREHAT